MRKEASEIAALYAPLSSPQAPVAIASVKLSKKRPGLEWIAIMVFGTLLFTALRLWLHVVTYHQEPGVYFTPWHDLWGMYQFAPFGWCLVGLIGPLWMVLAGLVLVRRKRHRAWHLLTLAGVVFFSSLWPSVFWAWMGI